MSLDDSVLLTFDKPTAIFMPGQIITGRVVFLTSNPLKISRVTIKFKGKCKISFTKLDNRYIGKQLYLKNEIALSCDKGESQVGKYVYPFNFRLPSFIPSTFFCKYGYIRYIAKAKICRPWKSDEITQSMFLVVSPINLNYVPLLSEPKCALKEKSYSFCCLLSGSMKLQAYIPYSGFVPGQTIPVTIKLDNNSNVNVEYVIIRLERKWKINAQCKTSRKSDIVHKVINGADKHTSKTRKVEARLEALAGLAKVAFNIMLGNVPLITANDPHHDNQTFQLTIQKYCSHKSVPTYSFPFVD